MKVYMRFKDKLRLLKGSIISLCVGIIVVSIVLLIGNLFYQPILGIIPFLLIIDVYFIERYADEYYTRVYTYYYVKETLKKRGKISPSLYYDLNDAYCTREILKMNGLH